MEIRKLTEKDRLFYRKICRYAFSASENNYEKLDWPPDDMPINRFYGAFDNDVLIAGSGIIPFEIKVRSKTFKMGGVDGVATKPEFRNRGVIREIFKQIYQDLYKNKIPISVLYPFKISYYEKLGYAVVNEEILYHFEISSIINRKTNYFMKEVEEINEDIKHVYDEIINKYDYIAKRSEIQWKDLVKSNYKFICYDKDRPVGYIFLHFPKKDTPWWEQLDHIENTIYIRETFWLNQSAKQTIFNFLWSHRDQRKYIAGAFPVNENIIGLLNNPRILAREIHPNSMLKIIDVKTILESLNYSISDFSISIRVHDKDCPWNNSNFLLTSDNKIINVKVEENKEESIDLEIDIGHFAQLLVGFRTIDDLLEYDFVTINKKKLELIKKLFPLTSSNFSDFF